MDSLDELLKKKAGDIDIDDKLAAIDVANKELKRFIGTNGRVEKVTDKTIVLSVKSSVIASEIRLMQIAYLESVSKALDTELTKLHIKVR